MKQTMTIYNTTAKVSNSIAEDWLVWQQRQQLPAIMQTDLFDDYRIFRLTDPADTDGVTFIIQLITSSTANCSQYITQFAPDMERKATNQWNGEFVFFCSVMESVN